MQRTTMKLITTKISHTTIISEVSHQIPQPHKTQVVARLFDEYMI